MTSRVLIAGDVLTLAAVTLSGFASHGELSGAFTGRMAASLIPLWIGWFLLAPILGLFEPEITGKAAQLWRPVFVMLFAGPLAAVMRGAVLNSPIIPSFAVVLSLTGAAGLTLWRAAWVLLDRSRAPQTARRS